ncbi:MAG: hypothetical protein FD130_306 [Halothiobacillaceae bacterium]|nr:MAG: hypothetical protein FD130_306 [Halothiobacillaceae bacterium]
MTTPKQTTPLHLHIALLLLGLFTPLGTSSAATLYKWVDANGDVQFGDAIPPDAIQGGHSEINRQGLNVKQVGRAKTKEEVEIENTKAAEIKRQQEEEKLQRQQTAEANRVLLDTYVSEEDLTRMRDRQISTIEGSIKLTESNLERLHKTLNTLKSGRASSQPNTEIDAKTAKLIQDTEAQIVEYEAFVHKRRAEQDTIRAHFARDLARFRELTAKR